MPNNTKKHYLCGFKHLACLLIDNAHQGINDSGSGHLLFGKVLIIIYYYNSINKKDIRQMKKNYPKKDTRIQGSVQSKKIVKKQLNSGETLDKLAQLSSKHNGNKTSLIKRAKRKYIGSAYIKKLAALDSPLHNSYNNSLSDCANVLTQIDKTITSKYCKNRWCLVCNSIRTAKLINEYLPVLKPLKNKYLLTLTIPNVRHDKIYDEIRKMTETWRKINLSINQYSKVKLKGVRKLECTYNYKRNDYHPHFHILISGKKNAEKILKQWLKHYPAANRKAQDIRPANNDSLMEIFKYFTKIIADNKKIHIQPLDHIFFAMRGKRVYQPFGIKKVISEEIEELQSEEITGIEPKTTFWKWLKQDWIDYETAELLTGYEPDEKTKTLISNIQ